MSACSSIHASGRHHSHQAFIHTAQIQNRFISFVGMRVTNTRHTE